MFEVTQSGPGVWNPPSMPLDLSMGMAAPLTQAEAGSLQGTQVESYGKPITPGEIDIPTLSQEILALLANPPEELKVGSPETAPLLSVHLGPFSIGEITIVPGATVGQRRLVVRVNAPIVYDDTQSQHFVGSLIERATSESNIAPNKRVSDCLPTAYTWQQSLIRKTLLKARIENYFHEKKQSWFTQINNGDMSEDAVLEIQTQLWELLTSFSDDQHSTPIGTEVDILLTGFVDHLNTTRLTDAKKWLRQNWLNYTNHNRDNDKFVSFVDTIFPDSALEPNRSRVLFPDTIEFQLKLSGGNQNEKTVPYGLALLKAASGIWRTQMSDQELILSAGGGLISPDKDSTVPDASRADQRLPATSPEISSNRRQLGFPGAIRALTGTNRTNAPTSQTPRPIGFRQT